MATVGLPAADWENDPVSWLRKLNSWGIFLRCRSFADTVPRVSRSSQPFILRQLHDADSPEKFPIILADELDGLQNNRPKLAAPDPTKTLLQRTRQAKTTPPSIQMFVRHGSGQDLHRLRRALFLSPRLNKQLVDQQRIGVLEMIDESFPVVTQLPLRQYTGTDHLVVQNLE